MAAVVVVVAYVRSPVCLIVCRLSIADHIPDSYRDDLLREIALMKGIGLHPNIVTMVGACTSRDPIALIMEYVPYGNLQSFLKLVLKPSVVVVVVVVNVVVASSSLRRHVQRRSVFVV